MTMPYDPTPQALFTPERQPTVFGRATPAGPDAVAVEAARLAYVRWEESPAGLARLTADLALAGFGAPTPFDDTGTGSQAYGTLHADGTALLAVRGTQADKLPDLFSDLRFLKSECRLVGGHIHEGFLGGALALWQLVRPWLEGPAAGRKLLVCGHSLGAAIATVLAVPARAARLVTIGSPRVGDDAFVAALARAPVEVTRIVDADDVVARVPPRDFGYHHLGHAVFIDANGNAGAGSAAQLVDRDVGLLELPGLLAHFVPHFPGPLPRSLTDHAPINYVRAFWR